MRDREITRLFEDSRKSAAEPDSRRRAAGLAEIAGEIEDKHIQVSPGLFKVLIIQLRYMEKRNLLIPWIFTAGLLLAGQYLMDEPKHIMDFFAVMSVVLAMMSIFGVLSIGRLFSYNMAELEQICYFNLGQLASIQMLLSVLTDAGIMMVCVLFFAGRIDRSWLELTLYLTVPFLVATGVYLAVFTLLRGRGQGFGLVAASLLLVVVYVLLLSRPMAYERSALAVWVLIMVGGLTVLVLELRQLFYNIAKGETICLQWN